MATVPVRRGYRESLSLTFLGQSFSDMRVRITCPDGIVRLGLAPNADGAAIALSTVTDERGTHTRAVLTMPPAATRRLGEGAVNFAECERLPAQEYLGAFTIEGSAGLNDD
jgi:hypothetical protein